MSAKKRSRAKAEEEFEPGSWECTVCTFRNRVEAFKCEMCDTRKGTSTRKPRLNQNVVQHHTVVQNFVVQQSLAEKPRRKIGRPSADSPSTSRHSPESTSSGSAITKSATRGKSANRKVVPLRDSLIIRSSAKKHMITVKGVTACIIEFKPRPESESPKKSADSKPTAVKPADSKPIAVKSHSPKKEAPT
uniref:RanBP2-type domain-containing protein n=1 Tax=Ascaris lumbricoides TaxID=6252 RepID=A0A0M3I522_ASCLU